MAQIRARTLKAASFLLALSTVAAGQTYPTKPVRIIVPFPPGASNDIVARLVGTHLSHRLGKQVFVDNRSGGAGGVVGTEIAANSPPDGHTLLIISLPHAVNRWLYKLSYDPIKSFVPISILATGPNILAVNPSLPVNSVQELVALAKQNPGQLQYASAGVGSFQHLGGELFKLMAGVDIMHVPFKGGGPALVDVMSGRTKIIFSTFAATLPHIRSGKLRALATGGATRSPLMPELPTLAEAGVHDYEVNNWWGIVAPAGTPQPIVDRLNHELTTIMSTAVARKQFEADGATIVQMSPAEFGKFLEAEIAKWGRLIREGGIRVE
jgi:tripartite-type tricarboxylate transporter receptor subunit TctC